MDSNLVRLARGDEDPTYRDRRVAKQAKQLYDDVRLAGMQIEGAAALAAHAMETASALDGERKLLPGNADPIMAVLLLEMGSTGLAQMQRAQRGAFRRFGL